MPEYILPTLTISTNGDKAVTNPGPSSFSISGSITPADSGRLTVDKSASGVATVTTTRAILASDTAFGHYKFDGSAIHGATTGMTPGAVGGFVYLKNIDSTTGNNIHVGIVAPAHATNAPATPDTDGTASSLDGTTQETLRTMTLLPGEFAFFPWDYTGDIYVESAQNSPKLEFMVWDRG